MNALACLIQVNGLSPVVESRPIHVYRFQPQVPTALMLKPAAHPVVIKLEGLGACTSAGQAAAFIPTSLGQLDLPAQFICSHL